VSVDWVLVGVGVVALIGLFGVERLLRAKFRAANDRINADVAFLQVIPAGVEYELPFVGGSPLFDDDGWLR